MSAWTPSDVEPDTRSIWVVSLEWAGGTVYLGDQQVTVTSDDGDIEVYGGLTPIDWMDEAGIPLGEGVEAEPGGIEVEARFPPHLDVPALVEAGHRLDGVPVEVSIVIEGQAWEDRRIVLSGTVLSPRYGHPEDPVSFSADASVVEDNGSVPEATRVITDRTWPDALEANEGLSFPVVIGRPGDCDGRKAGGSTAILVDTTTRKCLIADGHVTATTVYIRDDDHEGGTWLSRPVTLGVDNLGNRVSTILLPSNTYATGWLDVQAVGFTAGDTITIGGVVGTAVGGAPGVDEFDISSVTEAGLALAIDDMIDNVANGFAAVLTSVRSAHRLALTAVEPGGSEVAISHVVSLPGAFLAHSGALSGGSDQWLDDHTISVSWSAAAAPLGGIPRERSPTSSLTGAGSVAPGTLATAGEVLEWMLNRTTQRVDAGRTRVAAELLSQVQIAVSIEATTSPMEWIRGQLLPILPVSLVAGPLGIYPLVWRWWGTARDAVADIDLDRDLGDLVSGVEAAGDIASEIDLSYARDLGMDEFRRRLLLTGDPAVLRSGVSDDLGSSVYARAAFARYGRVPLVLESDCLYDRGSAFRVAEWLSMARWCRHRTLAVALPRTIAGWLRPGDVVTFTYAALSMDSKPAIVTSVSGLTESVTTLGLTLIEHPAGVAGKLV